MDAKLKSDWVKALRSGEYEQGHVYFERENKFCCLGVLCRVAGKPIEVEPTLDNWRFVDSVLWENIVPRLIAMNDDYRNSFEEIADYIEANIPADEPEVSL